MSWRQIYRKIRHCWNSNVNQFVTTQWTCYLHNETKVLPYVVSSQIYLWTFLKQWQLSIPLNPKPSIVMSITLSFFDLIAEKQLILSWNISTNTIQFQIHDGTGAKHLSTYSWCVGSALIINEKILWYMAQMTDFHCITLARNHPGQPLATLL